MANFKGKTVLYFPVFIGPITVSYNLSGVSNLKLTPTVIADIFQGKITTWNNSAIAAINPGVKPAQHPDHHRRPLGLLGHHAELLPVPADGRGEHVEARQQLDHQLALHRPAGNGNGGVAQIVKSTPGAIGYVDYADAKASGLTFASVKNSSGNYVAPSPSSASAAGTGTTVASNLTFPAVGSSEPHAYPITYQSWVLVYEKQPNANDAAMLKAYIGYLIGAGQQLLPTLGYAPLPSSLDQKAEAQLSKIGS